MPQTGLYTLLMKMAAPGTQPGAATISSAVKNYKDGLLSFGVNGINPLKWQYNPLKWITGAKELARGGFGPIGGPLMAATELRDRRNFTSTPAAISDLTGRMGSWAMPSAGSIGAGWTAARALAAGATATGAASAGSAVSKILGPVGWAGFGAARLLNHYAKKMHEAWKQEDATNANAADTSRSILARLALMDPALRAQKMRQKPFQTAMINASQAVGGKPIHTAGRKDISPWDLTKALGVSQQDINDAYNPNSNALASSIKREVAIRGAGDQVVNRLVGVNDWASKNQGAVGAGLAAAGLSIPVLMALRAKMAKRKKKVDEDTMNKASAYLHKVAYGVNARPDNANQPQDPKKQDPMQMQGANPSNIMEIQNLMKTPSQNPSEAWGQDVVAAQGRGTQKAQDFVRGPEIPNRLAQQKERAHAYTQSLPEVQMQNRMRAGMHPIRNESLPQRGTPAPTPVTIRPSMSFAEWQKGKASRMAAQAAMIAKTRAQAAAGGGVTYNVRRPAPAPPAAPTAQAVAAKLDRIPNLQAAQSQWQRQNNSRMAARRSSPQAQQSMLRVSQPNTNFKQAPPKIAVPRPPQR